MNDDLIFRLILTAATFIIVYFVFYLVHAYICYRNERTMYTIMWDEVEKEYYVSQIMVTTSIPLYTFCYRENAEKRAAQLNTNFDYCIYDDNFSWK